MLCVRNAKRSNASVLFNCVLKARYSRRSDKSTSCYKVVKSNGESLDDVENTVFGTNSNWELLTPRGFRFYLPGSIGPGWLDVATTAQVKPQFINIEDEEAGFIDTSEERIIYNAKRRKYGVGRPMLHCVAQECPILLRKGIEELFPGCLEVTSPQLTIVTLSQKTNLKIMKRSKEMETEKLAKYFVLAASDICAKLKLVGYWADFINPFSGQPYFNTHKNNTLYKTDERFRCLGFKIEHKNNCRIISYDNSIKTFIGSLYTTAPASTEFLNELINDVNGD